MQDKLDPEAWERTKRSQAERRAKQGIIRDQSASAWGGIGLGGGGGGGGGGECGGGGGGGGGGRGGGGLGGGGGGECGGGGSGGDGGGGGGGIDMPRILSAWVVDGVGGSSGGGTLEHAVQWKVEDFDLDVVGDADGADDSDGQSGPTVPLAPLAAAGGASQDLGRWGEAAVSWYLSRRYPDDRVVWVNREAETRLPYDIIIRRRPASTAAARGGEPAEEALYVEVKTTGAVDKRAFELSLNELGFALGHPGAYHIYRVEIFYAATEAGGGGGECAGRPTARVRVVKDLAAALGVNPPVAKLLLQLE